MLASLINPGSIPRRSETLNLHVPHPLSCPKRWRARTICMSSASFKRFEPKTLEKLADGTLGDYPAEDLLWEIGNAPLDLLTAAAGAVRDRRPDANVMTFSPKVFIPLTRACRNSCGYCTFALPPKAGQKMYLSSEEVLEIARNGAKVGCSEALFTLGDKPELLYPAAMEELGSLGHTSTISYVAEMAKSVLKETGLLPHINAGIISRAEVQNLRQVSVSQGLMLESISERLLEFGGPHYRCVDKVPQTRVQMIVSAGEQKVPFTSGLLIGVGETREEQLQSLLLLRSLHQQYGHIQELIVQNFRSKKGTRMANAAEPSLEDLIWTIAMARLAFGSSMNIQAPPNLTPTSDGLVRGSQWKPLIEAGINDWGGISPITKDWVNPEAPWPHIQHLAKVTLEMGKVLVPRLAVYPYYVQHAEMWLDGRIMKWVHSAANSLGYARADLWSPGLAVEGSFPFGPSSLFDKLSGKVPEKNAVVMRVPGTLAALPMVTRDHDATLSVDLDGTIMVAGSNHTRGRRRANVDMILDKVMSAKELTGDEIETLFSSVGEEVKVICSVADDLRSRINGEKVTYVVNRNINYTNICSYSCAFCAFSKGQSGDNLRGKPYQMSLEEISQRTIEAWDRGATEICMQGGIHPAYSGKTYLDILHAVKSVVPQIHVHAFSPLEVFQGAATLGISVGAFLSQLKEAGLGSLPGTAAEVLDDEVRRLLCPDKITTQQWLEVMEIAHCLGLRSTATIMFGHVDQPTHWARHLIRIRDLQKQTCGFTEFVPLPFVHMEAPLYLRGKARKGPTKRECLLMHAIARLALHPLITNIQASWVKMGPGGAQFLLSVGCNDMGGSLMNESITRAAGASHGQELHPIEMARMIQSIGRIPQQRTTLYESVSHDQVTKSLSSCPMTRC